MLTEDYVYAEGKLCFFAFQDSGPPSRTPRSGDQMLALRNMWRRVGDRIMQLATAATASVSTGIGSLFFGGPGGGEACFWLRGAVGVE